VCLQICKNCDFETFVLTFRRQESIFNVLSDVTCGNGAQWDVSRVLAFSPGVSQVRGSHSGGSSKERSTIVPVYMWKAYVDVEVNSACVRVEGIRGCGG
jgi:hypothetical protein